MKRPNIDQTKAIVELLNDPNFALYVQWLNEQYEEVAKRSIHRPDEPQRSWLQGQAQQIEYEVECIKNARRDLDAIMKQGGKR